MSHPSSHYTFGDSKRARERLFWLSRTYAPSSREFLQRFGVERPDLALDLGCGPGYTTALVYESLAPQRTIGFDASTRYIEFATASASPGIEFVRHDVLAAPFPCPPAQFLYCRFLLTHLHCPRDALTAWAQAAAPKARLLIEETAALSSPDQVFQRYYRRVAELQSGYGQKLQVGTELTSIARSSAWKVVYSAPRALRLPATTMARLHAMNLSTWTFDPFAQQHFDRQDLDEIRRELELVAAGERSAPAVTSEMQQLVLELPG